MKKLKFILPNILVCVVISLVAIILPIEAKNPASFIYTLICFILFNGIGCIISNRLTDKSLKKDINNISTLYIYLIFDILLAITLFISKIFNISVSIMVIISLVMFAIYFITIYSLINAKEYINNHDDKVYDNVHSAKKWISSIEILLANEGKDNTKLKQLYESLKYMDITSNESTEKIDKEITNLIYKIENNIDEETIINIEKLINKRKTILKSEKR